MSGTVRGSGSKVKKTLLLVGNSRLSLWCRYVGASE